jgi:hypothetical protein
LRAEVGPLSLPISIGQLDGRGRCMAGGPANGHELVAVAKQKGFDQSCSAQDLRMVAHPAQGVLRGLAERA